MKIIKWIFKIILLLVIILGIFIGIVLLIDRSATGYLNSSAYPDISVDSYLIKNVNILPMTSDTIITGHSILIKDGIIREIGTDIDAVGTLQIDAGGRYLSPGLIDMHVHVWDKYDLGLYLANGVTGIRILWGLPMHLRIKKAIKDKELIGPAFYVSSPKLTGPDDFGDDKVQLNSPERARELVSEYKGRGYDLIKTYAGITAELMQAVLEQSKKDGLDVVSHPSFNLPYDYHFHPQVKTIEHVEDIVQQPLNFKLDSVGLEQVVAGYTVAGTSFSPTVTGYHKILEMMDNPDILESDLAGTINPLMYEFDSQVQLNRWSNELKLKPEIRELISDQHQFHLYIIEQLHQAGVNIVCSTDAGIGITAPGYSMHQELRFYVQAGMTNFEALSTATINPSTTHSFLADMGSIEDGKRANLLLTEENPLANLATLQRPVWVMVQGRKIDQQTLSIFEEKGRGRKNYLATAIRYAEYLLIER